MITILAVCLVFIIFIIWQARSFERANLKGFWKADATFCEQAELHMFMLYVGDNFGYLLAKNQNGIILNNPIKIDFSGMSLSPIINDRTDYTVNIDFQDNPPDSDVILDQLSAEYYPKNNKLILYSDDTIYAILYKDSALSGIR
jgi:hypothetical protein